MESEIVCSFINKINKKSSLIEDKKDEFKKIMDVLGFYFNDNEIDTLFNDATSETSQIILERLTGKRLEYLKEKTISGISDNHTYIGYLIDETEHNIIRLLSDLPEIVRKEHKPKEGFQIANYIIYEEPLQYAHLGLYSADKDSYLTTVQFVLDLVDKELIRSIYHNNKNRYIDFEFKCTKEEMEKLINDWTYIKVDEDYDWKEIYTILNRLEKLLWAHQGYEMDLEQFE